MSWSADSRLAERIRARVAHVVLYELQDPRITFPTITRVRLAKDLSTCRVYYSVLGSEADRKKTAHALEDARGFVQRQVAAVLRTRVTPVLKFEYDESIEGGMRMHGLLKQLKNERGEDETEEEGQEDPDTPESPEDRGE